MSPLGASLRTFLISCVRSVCGVFGSWGGDYRHVARQVVFVGAPVTPAPQLCLVSSWCHDLCHLRVIPVAGRRVIERCWTVVALRTWREMWGTTCCLLYCLLSIVRRVSCCVDQQRPGPVGPVGGGSMLHDPHMGPRRGPASLRDAGSILIHRRRSRYAFLVDGSIGAPRPAPGGGDRPGVFGITCGYPRPGNAFLNSCDWAPRCEMEACFVDYCGSA